MSTKIHDLAPGARAVFDLATTTVTVFAALIAVGALASSLIAGNLPGEPLAPLSKVTVCLNAVTDPEQSMPAETDRVIPVSAHHVRN